MRRKMTTATNIAVVILLVLILLAIRLMPEYNYAVIVERAGRIERRLAALEDGFEKLNILGGKGEEARGAVLANIDFISGRLRSLDQDLAGFMGTLAGSLQKVEDLRGRVEAVGKGLRAEPGGDGEGPRPAAEKGSESNLWPGELVIKATGLSPGALAEMEFQPFLETLIERGPAAYPGIDGKLRESGEERLSALRNLYVAYRSCISIVNLNEKLFLEALVGKATKEGSFLEEGRRADTSDGVSAPRDPGVVHVKDLGDGRRRTFYFMAEDHKEFLHFERLREQALTSVLAAVDALSRS